MQFIDQIKLFCEFTRTHILSPSAQLIWFRLININNECAWAEEFQVDNNRLLGETGIKSEKTLIKHRQQLVDVGLIEFDEGSKEFPSTYRINELYRDDDRKIKTKSRSGKQSVAPKRETKKKKKKPDDTKKYKEVMDFYLQHKGNMLGIQLGEGPVKQRIKALKKLERSGYTLQDVKQAILVAEQSDFLNGRVTGSDFRANFDWIIKPQNITKILDGNYENRPKNTYQRNNTYSNNQLDEYLTSVVNGQINIDGTLNNADEFTDFEIETDDGVFDNEIRELTQ